MLRIEHVLGSRIDAALAEPLHKLEHRGGIDVVDIPAPDLARRRLLVSTRKGEELAIALPRAERLFDGAVLLLEADRAIVVRAATERWLRLEPRSISDAVELGYQVGNLHWRVRFGGEVLLVALEGRPEDYTARIENLVAARRVAVTVLDEESADSPAQADAAPGSGHGHHHHHGDH
ncbi:putative Urease accessory protein UreE [Bradyrhizobium sp. ORS 278]|uniref:urease accessory protein UreE n=1 Tax=Bradyrhizobium sp. (strain ORS 278) TaxID=114615 RepID=UPI00015089F2|nr:urease accessory protein UreE [Bradyrhizobium sp. ORS 278]CAL79530.1 putative Urease accessory protein UreE [Bradyrhizobium sp. ORS 278]